MSPTLTSPPATLEPAVGRDESPTFTWRDADGRIRWLGRTTMPQVRAEALVEAYQPGAGNTLVYGIGNGAEVRRLLDRLLPCQAVFVIEEEQWQADLALKLHDFSNDLQNGRLILVTGERAWDQYAAFCREHSGYLVAERILAWPWFKPEESAQLSQRVSSINAPVEEQRSTQHRNFKQNPPAKKGRTIAILSTVSDPSVYALARALSNAAEDLDFSVSRFVRDDPSKVHPYRVEAALIASPPTLSILIDTAPAALLHPLHTQAAIVLCSHTSPLDNDWLRAIPNDALLAVRNQTQHRAALDAGRSPSRVVCIEPAANPLKVRESLKNLDERRANTLPPLGKGRVGVGSPTNVVLMEEGSETLTQRPSAPPTRLAILADFAPTTAESVGLHLGSHTVLWKAAASILEEQIDRYDDAQAEKILRAAENRIGVRLSSDEVRAGLITRIRGRLGPVAVRRAYCLALIRAGYEIDIYGRGADAADDLAEHHRGPLPQDASEALAGAAAVIALDPGADPPVDWMNAVAAGRPAWLRSASPPPALAGILDPREHYACFDSRKSLIKLARDRQSRPADFETRAEKASRHVLEHHTWTNRLRQMFALVGLD